MGEDLVTYLTRLARSSDTPRIGEALASILELQDTVSRLEGDLNEARNRYDAIVQVIYPPMVDGVWLGTPLAAIIAIQDERADLRSRLSTVEKERDEARALAYDYPPSPPFAPEGFTWKQRCAAAEARAARLEETLRMVREIISEGAMTGFNCHDGDWAERLFASQGSTAAALTPTDTPVTREKVATLQTETGRTQWHRR